MKNYKFKPLAPFASYDEEANFWDTHNALEDWTEEKITETLRREKKEVVIHVKVEPALKRALEERAREDEGTVSSVIRRAVKAWVARPTNTKKRSARHV